MTHPNQITRDGALRVLYALDIGGAEASHQLKGPIERHLAVARELEPELDRQKQAIVDRVEQLFEVWDDLNEQIQSVSPNWRVERMSIIDRNILRLACWEIQHGDQPPAVIIDACVDLGKDYGASETSSFVNGLLEEFVSTRGLSMK